MSDCSNLPDAEPIRGDQEHAEIEQGLQAAFESDPFDSLRSTSILSPLEQPGQSIGDRYRLIERIGEGGMGTVWTAEQQEPVRRRVAIKLIKPGMDSRSVVARFEAERQALALMDHPHIAKVLDGGVTQTGRPYFVMELVEGIPVTQFCDSRRLTPNQRLELFLPICQAIQHAHQKGIIHRDIKPSNVLVASQDDRPVPKIIDFGLAKAIGFQLTDQTLHTGLHAIMGTIEFMSPEQAKLSNRDIDTRSDIYSLGVLLYELLSGSPPFRRKELESKALDEILRVIREVDPLRPSMKLSSSETKASISAARSFEPLDLTRKLADDLDWIALKALDKDRSRRYQTANALARDIERYLGNEGIDARPPSTRYRIRKFVSRNHKLVLAGMMMLGLIVLGSGVSIWQAVRATRAFRIAQINEQRAVASEREVQQAIESEREARVAEQRQFELAESRRLEAEAALKESERQRAAARLAQSRAREVLDSMTSSIAGRYLTSQEILTPEQREFLQQALQIYKELSEEQSEEEQTLGGAYATMRLSLIQSSLGDDQVTVANFSASAAKLEALLEQDPTREEVVRQLIDAYIGLNYSQWKQGQFEEAEKSFQRGEDLALKQISIQQTKSSPATGADSYWRQIAKLKAHQGLLYRDLRQTDAMFQQLREATAIFHRLNPNFKSNPTFQAQFAMCQLSLAEAEAIQGEWEEAKRLFSDADQRLEKLVLGEPSNLRFVKYHSTVLRSMARSYNAKAEYEPASESCQRSEAILQEQVRKHPFALDLKSELANTLVVRYRIECNRRQFGLAQESMETARKLMTILVELQPHSYEFFNRLSHISIELARFQLDQQQSEISARQHLALLDLWQQARLQPQYETLIPPRQLYEFRRVMAMASGYVSERSEEFWELASHFNSRMFAGQEQATQRLIGETDMLAERTWGFMARDKPEDALSVLSQAEDKFANHPNGLYILARCYGLIAGARGDRKELRESAALKAIELLKRAQEAGWQNFQDATLNADFNSLRDHPDFQQWLIEDPCS